MASAYSFLATMTEAAPSESWEALPAVVEPSFLKAGGSLARPSIVVPSRYESSLETVTFCSSPVCLSMSVVSTSMTSRSKRPVFQAFSQLFMESMPMRSWRSRVMPYFSATFSLVMPIGSSESELIAEYSESVKTPGVQMWSCLPILRWVESDSTPRAMPTSVWPLRMAPATSMTAWRPEEHARCVTLIGTTSGMPASNWATRAWVRSTVVEPTVMSPMSAASRPDSLRPALMTAVMSLSACVSLSPPRPILVSGVRRAETTTTSSALAPPATALTENDSWTTWLVIWLMRCIVEVGGVGVVLGPGHKVEG